MRNLKLLTVYLLLILAMAFAVLGLRIQKNATTEKTANNNSMDHLRPQMLSVGYSDEYGKVNVPEHFDGFDEQVSVEDNFGKLDFQDSSTELLPVEEKDTLAEFSLRVSNFAIATVVKIALFFMEFICSPNSLVCVGIAAYVKPMFDNDMVSSNFSITSKIIILFIDCQILADKFYFY